MINFNFIIDDKIVSEIRSSVNLDKNILIYGRLGVGKTTLLKKIVQELLKDKDREIYILSYFKEEYKFESPNIKANIDINDDLDIIKKMYKQAEGNKKKSTVIIDFYNEFIDENEENKKLIYVLYQIGLSKGINTISATHIKEIDPIIESNSHTKLIFSEIATINKFEVKNRWNLNYLENVMKEHRETFFVGDPKGVD